jgi:hypothetical protein
MRKAIGAIFNLSCEPNTHKTAASLPAKWDKLAKEKAELRAKASPVTWPRQGASK